ncbi:hypothetical protein [Dokdonia sp.]|uniref:hypothetical protein n=1 Tax=Dokdonia sp. TaxID=2024995 RepID=UPI003264EC30
MKIFQTTLESKIKKISIRGRLAFGINCIENYLTENNIVNQYMVMLVDTLWEATTSERLDLWEKKISDLDPSNILDPHPENFPSDYKLLTETAFYELKTFYINADEKFIFLIENTIEIGIGNLYGGTQKYSPTTLASTLDVHKIAISVLKEIPDINKFQFSKFSEHSGWGNPIKRINF